MKVADLHTSTSGIASLESDGPLCAGGTAHPNILIMSATVHSKSRASAVSESGLIPSTLDISQPYLPLTIGEATGQSNSTCSMQ
jgi:hypothetical protein